MQKFKNLLENIKEDFSNYSKTIDVYLRETSNDLSVYSVDDESTDKVIKAMNESKGIEIHSSDFKRSNGFTHFIKYPANFEATKKQMKNIRVNKKLLNVIHLNRQGDKIQ
jgi:hypothetical protein